MTQQDDITQRGLIERLTEIANRDSAVAVTVRADDLRALLSKLRAPVADGWQSIKTAPQGVRVLLGPRHAPVIGIMKHYEDADSDEPAIVCNVVHYNGTVLVAGYRTGEWAPLASAPVAGEQIIAWDVQDTGLGRRYTTYNPKIAEDLMNLGENVRPLVYASALPPANAAPQASEAVGIEEAFAELDRIVAVRNAALEQAAAICDSVDNHANPMTARDCADAIRALKTQADKDGGQQRAGDGKTREALSWYAEKVAGCRKFGPDGEAARHALDRDGGQLARAALSAPQAEQGERDAG